jgi:hypothetical protein
VVAVERVPAAGEIEVLAGDRIDDIVRGVVEAAQRQRRLAGGSGASAV